MRNKTYSQQIADLRKTMRGAQRSSSALIRATAPVLRTVTSQPGSRVIKDHEREALNAMLYIALQAQDMAVLVEDFVGTKFHARKRVYARVIALYCVALFEGIPMLIGATVRSDAVLRAAPQGLALLEAAASLRPIRRKYESLLRVIRNGTIAHRDIDAIKQLETIATIDMLQFLNLISSIYRSVAEIEKSLMHVLNCMSERLSAASTSRASTLTH
jgi:hypothetical protein